LLESEENTSQTNSGVLMPARGPTTVTRVKFSLSDTAIDGGESQDDPSIWHRVVEAPIYV
jgi:hypothetical protein